jgi:hypothetical protein
MVFPFACTRGPLYQSIMIALVGNRCPARPSIVKSRSGPGWFGIQLNKSEAQLTDKRLTLGYIQSLLMDFRQAEPFASWINQPPF